MTVIGVVDTKDRTARIIREYLSASGHSVSYLSGTYPCNAASLSHLNCQYLVVYMGHDFYPMEFDVLVLSAKPKHYTLPKLPKTRLLLVSADDFEVSDNAICFGMGSDAFVTASSIETDSDRLQFTCCVQKEFRNLSSEMTLPGETPVCIQGARIPIASGLAGLSTVLALGLWSEEKIKILL